VGGVQQQQQLLLLGYASKADIFMLMPDKQQQLRPTATANNNKTRKCT